MQGHSLGGSLGTLLQLMFLRRGEIPAVAVSPTYTFGAPAVFCEGGACKVAASAEVSCLPACLPRVIWVVQHTLFVPSA